MYVSKTTKVITVLLLIALVFTSYMYPMQKSDAALVSGPKFLGNIIASSVPSNFSTYWNGVTPENSTKWGSVESSRGNYNWSQGDMAYNYARTNGFPFRFHTLVWGNQEPSWIKSLPADQQRAAVQSWIQAAGRKYPNADFVDVVNEPLHDPASYRNALGGAGTTGWDWVVWSFQEARKAFPNSKLHLNDYGIIADPPKARRYVEIINILKARGLIDGIGIQCHYFNMDVVTPATMKEVLDILTATGLPIYVTELDITGNDATQLQRYQQKFPVLWEHPNVKAVTLWGYIEGTTWKSETHLITRNGTERPALRWLKEYLSGQGTQPTSAPTSAPTNAPTNVPTSRSAFNKIEAEEFNSRNGANIEIVGTPNSGSGLGYIENGYTVTYNGINFGTGANSFKAYVATGATAPTNIEVRLNSATGTLLGTLSVESTGGWNEYKELSTSISNVTGVNNIVLRFTGPVNIDWFTFSASGTQPTQTPTNTPIQPTVTYGDLDGDGKIDSTDYIILRRYVLNITNSLTNKLTADLNGDGNIDSTDVILLRRYILEIIRVFPVQSNVTTPTPTQLPTPTQNPSGDVTIDWDWVGIIGTGQSLSVGAQSTPVRSGTQPYNNLKLDLGSLSVPPYDFNNRGLKMAPLTEPIRRLASGYPAPYPGNIYGETPHSAMGNQITSLVRQTPGKDYITAHTVVGESGQGMSVIRKGAQDTGSTGRAYAASIFEVNAINRLAKEAGKTYGVGGIILTHGETDSGSRTYKNDIHKLWSDYNTDIKAITGQRKNVHMFVTQQHSYPSNSGSSIGTLALWQVGLEYPDITCVGPKYQYSYASDKVHLDTNGSQMLGEKYGQVYYERVVLGKDWKPLQPVRAQRSGRVITVDFDVPVTPLVWDTSLPAPHQSGLTEWRNGKGFEVTSGNSRVTISSVEIVGNSVKITCATDLPTTGVKVGYAFTTGGVARSGGTVQWGQLRDSDPFKGSTTGKAQPNYCVSFEMAVN